MTNYEAYKDEIIATLKENSCKIYKIALAIKNEKCDFYNCTQCSKLTADWLKEEYKTAYRLENPAKDVKPTPLPVKEKSGADIWYNEKCKIEEALKIADRLERVDAREATFDYCNNVECDGVCDECYTLVDFRNGYEQALKDVRGEGE